jgi:hypothetical protein
MKKIAIGSAIAVALLLVLSACGGSDNTSDTSTTTTATDTFVEPTYEPAPAPEPGISDEDQYLSALHDMSDPYIDTTSDADLLEIGSTICDALDAGYTVEDIIFELSTNGTFESEDQAYAGGIIVAASATILCSEYASQVDDFIN